jgi:hypothetical protein
MTHTMTMSPLSSGRQTAFSICTATGSGDDNAPDYKHEDKFSLFVLDKQLSR